MSNTLGADGSLHRQRGEQPTSSSSSSNISGAQLSGGRASEEVGSNQWRRGTGSGGAEREVTSTEQRALARREASRGESFASGASTDHTWSFSGYIGGAKSSTASPSLTSEAAGSGVATTLGPSTPARTTSGSVALRRQFSGKQPTSSTAAGAHHQTSNTQRLSSIEILNENKQRQLQLEQQESFKQHLKQRQRFIQQQQDQHKPGSRKSIDYIATYQVETSAPEYARMAQAAGAASVLKSAGATVNPFDEDPADGATRSIVAASRAGQDESEPSTVSGRSGFLAALMGETHEGATHEGATHEGSGRSSRELPGGLKQLVDEGGDELDSSGRKSEQNVAGETRYSKVAQLGTHSYNYEDEPSQRPFYKKDIPTLLNDCRNSRQLVILIVAVALLLDNMLLTAVVPIIPAYLYKLRVEREHRELLSASGRSTAFSINKTAPRFSPLDINRDGRLDEAEIQAELDRRINQSIASAQDRFSGSFFHPRLVHKRPPGPGAAANQFDSVNEDDEDDDQVSAAMGGDLRRQSGTDETASDDEVAPKRRGGRYPRAKLADKSAKLDDEYEASDDNEGDDDDDNDDDDNDNGGGKNGKLDRDTKQQQKPGEAGDAKKSAAKPSVAGGSGARSRGKSGVSAGGPKEKFGGTKTTGQPNGKVLAEIGSNDKDKADGNQDDNEDGDDEADDDGDDDEDMVAVKKWNKLKKSLVAMAEMSGNDTDALGGMCLSMVIGRPGYFDGAKAVEERQRQRATSRRRPEQSKPSGDERKAGPRPRVDRLRPSTTTKSRDKDDAMKKDGSDDTQATKTSIIGDDEVIIDHQDIVDESFEVGVMFASKPIVQAIANPFVGAVTNRVGFTLPMFLGFTIMFLSTLVFAFGSTYTTLFMARAIQGVGSACTSVAGMSMIADRFPDDAERGNAMAVALGGLALGVVIGPPFGGFMYEFFGKPSPFIVLAILALLDGLLQLLVLQPRVAKCQEEGASLLTLIKDPYILVAAGAITFANTGIGILEPALPLWMMDTMQAKNWEQGVAFLPAALSYLFSTNLFGNLGLRIGRWRSAMLGLIIIGCSLLLIPFASRVDHLILPNGAIGFAIGMVDSTMMPMLGYLVDIRHTSVYGSVYAIGDVAFCASFVFGPALSGTLVELIGFEGLIVTTALICFSFAPLLILLKNPPARQLNEAQLQEQSTLRYVNYNHLDSPDEEAQLTADPRYHHYHQNNAPTAASSKSYVR